jgi:hypothetical protein
VEGNLEGRVALGLPGLPGQDAVAVGDDLAAQEPDAGPVALSRDVELVRGARDLPGTDERQVEQEAVARVAEEQEGLAVGVAAGRLVAPDVAG